MPQTTTWLDLVTLGVAIGGVLIACLSLVLTMRRDRQLGRVAVALSTITDESELTVRIVNTERRTVTAEKVGFAVKKHRYSSESFPWNHINYHLSGPLRVSDPPLPKTLEPGDPAYPIRTALWKVRGAFFPGAPQWVWCEDSYGTLHWQRLDEPVKMAILTTKRRKRGPDDDYGHPTFVDADDDEQLTPEELAEISR